MKMRKILSLCAAMTMLGVTAATAQQPAPQTPPRPGVPLQPALAMLGMTRPKSPEVDTDGAVTFRLKAPDARAVGVSGSWQPGMMAAPLPMAKGDDGVWQLTVNGLKPEIYTYNFVVDGVRTLDPGNVNVMRDGIRFLSAVTIPGAGSNLFMVNNVPHGTVEQVWYPSPSLSLAARRMYVYTPAGYESGHDRYPVFYLLHGGGGDEDAWDNLGRAPEILDNLIAAGKAKPMIVVMTNGNYNQTAAPGIVPQVETPSSAPTSSGMGQMLKFSDSIVADVIPFVDRRYRTIRDRGHRAIAGLSMGGAQTYEAAFHHMDQFAYVAAFSAGVIMFPGAIKPPAGQSGPLSILQLMGSPIDPAAMTAEFPKLDASANQKLRLLYITSGESDPLNHANLQFMDWLTSRGVQYKKMILPGYGHEWPFWRISLADLLPQLFN
ncbi:MAG: alpha/beta hydrolase-fold protein [Bryobacteraceae bacterium]|jgi:enterochelin esterase family protein